MCLIVDLGAEPAAQFSHLRRRIRRQHVVVAAILNAASVTASGALELSTIPADPPRSFASRPSVSARGPARDVDDPASWCPALRERSS